MQSITASSTPFLSSSFPNTQRKLLEEADQGTLAPMLAAAARRGSSRCRSSARRGGSRCRSSVRCGGSRCSSSARGGGSGCSSAAHRGASRCSSADQRVPELPLQLGAADGALVAVTGERSIYMRWICLSTSHEHDDASNRINL
ncbi:uncharacterized protein [Triticum aestivum]|uniref:uncharacterized protein n=1 Tax=Triticum aestivum TaxID=4565 RepID=UPI001D019FC7|nr:uncharacterized protein LOC123093551 [Triticum aestivum]